MKTSSSIKTAVLYCAYGNRASYYDDWLDAFKDADAFCIHCFNIAQVGDRDLFNQRVSTFELIVALHSVNADNLIYADAVKSALKLRKGLFLSFVGNEANLPGVLLKLKIDYLREVNADFVATQLLIEAGEYLYASTGAKVIAVPHALNPKAFSPTSLNTERPIDIGLRTFRYPSTFLGDDDRNRLIDLFLTTQFSSKLILDISTDKRLDRSGWGNFLNKCKGTIANEAGGYWIDKDDATTLEIKAWLKSQSSSGITIKSSDYLHRLAHKLPWSVRQILIKILSHGLMRHEALIGNDVDFEEVFKRFFATKTWPPKVTGKCVSSRHFDAAGTRTCQIMIEGRYNDIFKANEHYIPMKRDLSDIHEAVYKFRDEVFRNEIVERSYVFIMDNHTHAHRIKQIEYAVRSS
ncbi:glycosyltransferase [Alphaproteobacteria bacterium]|nr:glycosyltransferase [Alphaproteobacteria bacterium]